MDSLRGQIAPMAYFCVKTMDQHSEDQARDSECSWIFRDLRARACHANEVFGGVNPSNPRDAGDAGAPDFFDKFVTEFERISNLAEAGLKES